MALHPAPEPLRSLLFVPGSQPRMLDKAPTRVADVLVPDLEDSVADNAKELARAAISGALPALVATGRPILPRINGLPSGLLQDDLAAVVQPGVLGVTVGKMHTVHDILRIDHAMSLAEQRAGIEPGTLRLLPWLETAAAIVHAHDISMASPRIFAVAFGADDYAEDMGIERRDDESALVYPRNVVAVAARAAGIAALDTPYMNYRDPAGLAHRTAVVRQMGFTGKFAIHPDQVDTIHAGFAPSAEEVEQARRILEAFERAERNGQGAIGLDGMVIDVPVAKRARAVLVRAGFKVNSE